MFLVEFIPANERLMPSDQLVALFFQELSNGRLHKPNKRAGGAALKQGVVTKAILACGRNLLNVLSALPSPSMSIAACYLREASSQYINRKCVSPHFLHRARAPPAFRPSSSHCSLIGAVRNRFLGECEVHLPLISGRGWAIL